MIQVIPAIDIIGGRCVRLSQGDYSRNTSYDDSPLAMASRFLDSGIRTVHIVDLDGAVEGYPVNLNILKSISALEGLDIEWGGGMKNREDVESVLKAGASRAICGTMAVRNPEVFSSLLEEFGPDKIVLGADVRGREVAVNGWTENTGVDLFDLIESFLPNLWNVIVTEISRDGMLCGPDLELYDDILFEFPEISLSASGGISCANDIAALEKTGVPKVIVGKALYEGRISLEEIARWSPRG
ncbi:MAG: 1-(5-phosphoribosyl)-5-[(5-phosphoribosylamino)methylideneamino]imidazole-4-carboxamide isomerase [Bacteroidales bacterium]|nr:1-(5-phosphoribosyl)-5-[(5-phosphoribosylamino)methylideneamino]imidazole-4-carboxamide isomerase [Bacteroidales bacterium]